MTSQAMKKNVGVLTIAVTVMMLLIIIYNYSGSSNTLSYRIRTALVTTTPQISTLSSNTAPPQDSMKATNSIVTADIDKTTDKRMDKTTTKAVTKVEDNTTLPDCMELRKTTPYPTKGASVQGKGLCKDFTGTKRTDCVYKHPSLFNFVLFSTSPNKSVLNFEKYLAIYSAHKFYQPEKIVIHCNNKIVNNMYWELIQKLSTPVEQNHIDRITTIGKSHKKPGWVTHEADYFKVSTALKKGGIFSDFDVVVLNGTKLREMQSRSEVIMGRDNSPCSRTCAGFLSCVPGSPLLKGWLDSYENDYQPHSWLHNAGEAPSKLLHSCIPCYDAIVDMDISNWDEIANWAKEGKLNWKRKPVAHHMIHKFAAKEILQKSTPLAEMVKFVLGDTVKDFEDAT